MIYLPYLVGLLGVLFGARCYLELWRWAKQCQRAKIAIAHNRRVQLNATLAEYLSWANQLDDKQKSTGRVIYRNGKVSVAILRPDKSAEKTTIRKIRSVRKRRKERAPA